MARGRGFYDRVCPVCLGGNDTSREVVWCFRDDTVPARPPPLPLCKGGDGTGKPTDLTAFKSLVEAPLRMQQVTFSSIGGGYYCLIMVDPFGNESLRGTF